MPENLNIPGYELLEKLGSGSSGTVYKARQLSMDRPVAVKVLPGALAEDKRFIERFYREARAVAKLNHPNIVTGIDVGSAGGLYYFVMEYVDGEETADRVARDGPLPEEDALKIARQIAQALEHAFKNGIVHRDIKPANIMLTKDGLAKLADLGVARQSGGGPSASGGRVFGTPYYMSPEQARGEPDIDIRSDIYSLGATFYHLLAGKPPFHGDPPAVVMAKQIAEDPEDVRSINPKVSRAAAGLVAGMMAKSRDDRPEMPSDLIAAIDRVAKGQLPPGMRAAPRPALHHAHGDHGGAARRRTHKDESARGSKGLIVGTVLGTVLVIGAVMVALTAGSVSSKKRPLPPVVPISRDPSPGGRARRGPGAGGGPSKVGRKAEADKALKAAMKEGLKPELQLRELRAVIARYPGTEAAVEAASRVDRIELKIRTEQAQHDLERDIDRAGKKARGLIDEGELASAVRSVDPSRAKRHLQARLTDLRKQILNLGVLAIARAEVNALNLAKRGRFAKARGVLNGLKVKGVRELEERVAQSMARIAQMEGKKAEAAGREALQRAEAAYAELCEKVNAELEGLRPGEAEALLEAAREDKKFAPIADLIKEDASLVGHFKDAVAAALRGVEMLTGHPHAFAMRDGSTETGKVQGVTGKAIQLESRIRGAPGGGVVSRVLELRQLSDRELAKLALFSLNEDSGETYLKLAVLYSVGGNAKAASRQLQKARELGAEASAVASVERSWITTSSDELVAARLLRETRAHFKAGRYARARPLLARLRDQYSHTETYKRNYAAASQGKGGKGAASDGRGKAGHAIREYWTGIPGAAVQDLTASPAFRGRPAGTERLQSLQTKGGPGNAYGARVRGFVIPPKDGEYVFWICSDNSGELWLSTNEKARNKRKLASCTGYAMPGEWEKQESQRSKPIRLKAGRRYYLEVLHKQAAGLDHMAVGWRLPDGTLERPVPGHRLAPPE